MVLCVLKDSRRGDVAAPSRFVDLLPDGQEWRFCMVSVQLMRVLGSSRFSGTTLAVALQLAAEMPFDGREFSVRQREMMKAVGASRSTVARAFVELESVGFLIRGQKYAGQVQMWRLNPDFVWKGHLEKRKASVHELSLVPSGVSA